MSILFANRNNTSLQLRRLALACFPPFFRVLYASLDCPDSASWLMRTMLYVFRYVLLFSFHFNGFTVNSTAKCGRHARGFIVLSKRYMG